MVFFCDGLSRLGRMFPRFLCVVTQQLALFCYQIALPHRIYRVWFPVQRLTDTWVVSFLGTLWLMPPPTFVHRLLRARVKACPLGMYLGTRLQGHIGPTCFLC